MYHSQYPLPVLFKRLCIIGESIICCIYSGSIIEPAPPRPKRSLLPSNPGNPPNPKSGLLLVWLLLLLVVEEVVVVVVLLLLLLIVGEVVEDVLRGGVGDEEDDVDDFVLDTTIWIVCPWSISEKANQSISLVLHPHTVLEWTYCKCCTDRRPWVSFPSKRA